MKPLNITILTTREDIASMNIQKQLLTFFPFRPLPNCDPWDSSWVRRQFEFLTPPVRFNLIEIEHSFITLDNIIPPSKMLGDILIYASRHRSTSERKALLCHTTGNFSEDNSFGGSPRRISKGSGILMHYLYTNLQYFVDSFPDYKVPVDHEVDHHGPTNFTQPAGFIELGSTEQGWQDPFGAQIVARTIIHAGKIIGEKHCQDPPNLDKKEIKVVVGFGGSHYMPSFQPIIPKGYGFVHTVPKYKVLEIDAKMLDQIVEQSLESIDAWVVDWKGLNSAEKQHLIPLLTKTEIPWMKVKQLRKGVENK
ncbi:MAG: D-aminoacyl-tRNA deacylase [Promethearchaeota archaeon]